MMHRLVVFAFAFAAVAGRAQSPVDVRYVANSGVRVTVSGVRFLIDAPIRDGALDGLTVQLPSVES